MKKLIKITEVKTGQKFSYDKEDGEELVKIKHIGTMDANYVYAINKDFVLIKVLWTDTVYIEKPVVDVNLKEFSILFWGVVRDFNMPRNSKVHIENQGDDYRINLDGFISYSFAKEFSAEVIVAAIKKKLNDE